MKVLSLFLLCCFLLLTEGAFIHPGVVVSGNQLEFIKEQVEKKVEPIYTAFLKANVSAAASINYKVKGPPTSGVIGCGPSSNPNYGCSDDDSDSAASYAQALMWYITGNQAYANNAISILDSYGNNLVNFNLSNAPLQAAWSALKMVRAAEIIKHSKAGWPESSSDKFAAKLYSVYYPKFYPGSRANGNWELAMIDALFAIAVFSDNQTTFDRAATLWRERVPAYFYNFEQDGYNYVPIRGNPSWGGAYLNESTNGICQETCRDMSHTQMGISSCISAAETAYIQGLDLYSEEKLRITTALEFATQLLLGYSYPENICGGKNVSHLTTYYTTFETAYSAYSTRMGMKLNNTYTNIIRNVRRSNWLYGLTHAYETLTHSMLAPIATPSPTTSSSTTDTTTDSGTTSAPGDTSTTGQPVQSGAEKALSSVLLFVGALMCAMA